jgi:four helix bundle protein
MASIMGFRDLIAWQKGMDLVVAVYRVSGHFPPDERFGLIAQVRRAAVSVPSNIAEGQSRRTRAEFIHFLDVSRGSTNEVQTQLLISERLGFVPPETVAPALALADEVQRILRGLTASLEASGVSDVRPRDSELRTPNSELSS